MLIVSYGSNDIFVECERQDVIPAILIRMNFSMNGKGGIPRKKQGLIHLGGCKMNPKNMEMFNGMTTEQGRKIKNSGRLIQI